MWLRNNVTLCGLGSTHDQYCGFIEIYHIQTFPVPAGRSTPSQFMKLVNVLEIIVVYGKCVGDLALKTCLTMFFLHDFTQQTCPSLVYK